jgi:hypothetical protein
MIAAYHGKDGLFRGPRSSPSTPLRLPAQTRCVGFGGVTARLGRAKDAGMPFKAMPMCFDHGG